MFEIVNNWRKYIQQHNDYPKYQNPTVSNEMWNAFYLSIALI